MTFTLVALATAVASLLLGIGWLTAGGLVLKRWHIQANPTGLLVGRRLGAVYLSMALMLFMARSAPPSDIRTALCVGVLVGLTLLAALGLLELKAGRAGKGILASVTLELLLAAGFLSVLLTG